MVVFVFKLKIIANSCQIPELTEKLLFKKHRREKMRLSADFVCVMRDNNTNKPNQFTLKKARSNRIMNKARKFSVDFRLNKLTTVLHLIKLQTAENFYSKNGCLK